jgi:hypothetical protein
MSRELFLAVSSGEIDEVRNILENLGESKNILNIPFFPQHTMLDIAIQEAKDHATLSDSAKYNEIVEILKAAGAVPFSEIQLRPNEEGEEDEENNGQENNIEGPNGLVPFSPRAPEVPRAPQVPRVPQVPRAPLPPNLPKAPKYLGPPIINPAGIAVKPKRGGKTKKAKKAKKTRTQSKVKKSRKHLRR